MIKTITSRQNQLIQAICQLHDSKGRKIQKKFIGQGLRTCSTLLNNGCELEQLYITDALLETTEKLVSTDKITIVSPEVMEKISTMTTPSGIVGVFKIPDAPDIKTLGPGLVLAHLADPGNVGTLIRSAAAMNASVVIVEGADIFAPKVVQATAGAIAKVPTFQLSWQELVKHKGSLVLCALVASGGKKPRELDLHNVLLVVGNEAHGIPEQWLADCQQKLTLPMPGNTESLNAAIAGSIALYIAQVQQ